MSIRLRQFIALPDLNKDEGQARVAGLLNVMLLAILAASFLINVVTIASGDTDGLFVGAAFTIIPLILLVMLRQGYVQAVALIIPVMFLILVTYNNYEERGLRNAATSAYFLVVILAGLLLGRRATVIFSVLSVFAVGFLFVSESAGQIAPYDTEVTFSQVVIWSVTLGIAGLLLSSAVHRLSQALQRSEADRAELAKRADEIARFQALADNAVDAIIMGDDKGHVTYANKAAKQLFKIASLHGLDMRTMLKLEDKTMIDAVIVPQIRETGSWSGEVQHQKAENVVQDLYISTFQVQSEVLESTGAIIRDITEEKRAEAERLQLREQRLQLQEEIINTQRDTLEELSSPIIPLTERVIILPLIGQIDDNRASNILRNILAGISEHRAKILIMDITGVPMIDSGVAASLDRSIQAARLKGTQTIISGVSNDVAETIVELGINWSRLDVVRDLQTALELANQKRKDELWMY